MVYSREKNVRQTLGKVAALRVSEIRAHQVCATSEIVWESSWNSSYCISATVRGIPTWFTRTGSLGCVLQHSDGIRAIYASTW